MAVLGILIAPRPFGIFIAVLGCFIAVLGVFIAFLRIMLYLSISLYLKQVGVALPLSQS